MSKRLSYGEAKQILMGLESYAEPHGTHTGEETPKQKKVRASKSQRRREAQNGNTNQD